MNLKVETRKINTYDFMVENHMPDDNAGTENSKY
jgi:hypothetical protein